MQAILFEVKAETQPQLHLNGRLLHSSLTVSFLYAEAPSPVHSKTEKSKEAKGVVTSEDTNVCGK